VVRMAEDLPVEGDGAGEIPDILDIADLCLD
jgi:hypothetical protein